MCIDAKYEVDIIHKIRDGKCELSMKVPILPADLSQRLASLIVDDFDLDGPKIVLRD